MIATLVRSAAHDAAAAGGACWRGDPWSAVRCSSLVQVPAVLRRGAGAAPFARHRRPSTSGPSPATLRRSSSAAASSRSARMSISCSRACSAPAPWRRSPTRSCCTRCRSACSAWRSPPLNCRRWRASPAAIDARHSALRARLDAGLRQHRVLRRAFRHGLPRARRRDRRRRCSRPDASHHEPTRSTSGAFWRARRSDCSRRRSGRLYASTYYALGDTRTPLRYAIVRVALTTVLGYLFAIPLPRLLGVAPAWGAAGLTASGRVAGWVEMLLLRATAQRPHRPDRPRRSATSRGSGHRRARRRRGVDGETVDPAVAARLPSDSRARLRPMASSSSDDSGAAVPEASTALERLRYPYPGALRG